MNCEGRYTVTSLDANFLATVRMNNAGCYDLITDDGRDLGHYDTLNICRLVANGTWLIQDSPQ